MRLIGFVTCMSVNLQLVSEGNDGCFAEVSLPPFLGIPPVTCPMCLKGATSTHRLQVFRGHLHSKALKTLEGLLKVSPDFWIARMLPFPKRSPATLCCNGNGCA